MITSISPKDLLHDWNNKGLKKEALMYFGQQDQQDIAKKLLQKEDLKKEMNLPKTKLTKKGQLYLYTDGLTEETKLITNNFNKNLMQKAYSKKWIDDISDLNLNLNPLNLLSDSFEENASFVSSTSSKRNPAGRANDYFINNLRKSKTGKDRYTSKSRYQEFLPVDFNSKSELEDAIKQLNDNAAASRRNTAISLRNSQIQSRLTRTSTFSLLQEYELSSDEEKFDAYTSDNMGLSKATSRLSSQPVLSSQQLIDNLNFKLNSGFLIPGTNKKLDDFDDQKKFEESLESNLSGIHYKNTYQLEEDGPESSQAQEPAQSQSKINTERRDSVTSLKLENENTNKKILSKRTNKSNLNNQSNTENTETIAIKKIQPNSSANVNMSATKLSSRRSRRTSITANKKSLSPRMSYNNLADSNNNLTENRIDLLVLGPKRTETDNYLDVSNTSARTPHRTSFASHVSMQTPLNQISFVNGQMFHQDNNNNVYLNESLSENLAPITISVTKIDHELTGNSIKVRRFFDRQTMRIKRMPLYDSKTNTRIEDPNNAFLNMHEKQISHIEIEPIESNNVSKTALDPPFSTPDININYSHKESEKNLVYDSDNENIVKNDLDGEDDLDSLIKQRRNSEKIDELNSKISQVLDNSQQQESETELQTHEYLADLNQVENQKALNNSNIVDDPRTIKEQRSPIKIKHPRETNSARSSFESSSKIKLGEKKTLLESAKSINDGDSKLEEVMQTSPNYIKEEQDEIVKNKFQKAKKEAEKELENEINEINQMSEEEMSKMYMPVIGVKPLLENQNSTEVNTTETAKSVKDKDGNQFKVKPIKNPPTIRKFSLTSFNDKLDLKTLEENLKTDFRITSANINRKSASSTNSNKDSTNRKSSRSNGVSTTSSSSKANLNENEESKDYHAEENEPNIDHIPSEPHSIANDYYYITLKNQINFLNQNNDNVNNEENEKDNTTDNHTYKDADKRDSKNREFENDDEENLSTFKIIVKKKTEENSYNENSQSENEESHYTEIKINKFLTNSEIDEFEMKNEMEKLKEHESKKDAINEIEQERKEEENVVSVNQENNKLENKTTKNSEEIVIETKNEIKNEISRGSLGDTKKIDNITNSTKLSEITNSNTVTSTKSNEDVVKTNIEEKEEKYKTLEAYSNENSIKTELVKSEKSSEDNINSSLTLQKEPIESKMEPGNKSGKRVEFSNKVTEQIISDTVEGADEIKQDPVVKEVDFDVKFLERENEISNDMNKKNTLNSSPTKNAKTPSKPTASTPTASTPNNKSKSSSKSPPPVTKTKSAPVSSKGSKASSKVKASTKDSIVIETPVSVEETPLPVEEQKLTVDPLAKFNEILGIKEDKEPEKPKVVAPKRAAYLPRYPYLQIPWDTENAIVDVDAYRQTFMIPDVLVPQLHKIDAKSISVDELLLERRILEEKIIELRTAKLNAIHGVSTEKPKKSEKKNISKKAQKDILKSQKENEMKDSVIREERARLHTEAVRSQNAREAIGNLLAESIKEKEAELDSLNNQLETNTQEFEVQLNSVVNQIKYLETSEDEVRDMIAKNRAEFRDQWSKRQMELRRTMKSRHEDRKESKMFDFGVKKEELEWLLKMYNDPVEIEKINTQQAQLNVQIDVWLTEYENKVAEEEKEFDDNEEKEDNRLTLLEQEEEENSLISLKQEQFEMLQAKKTLVENFEEMKNKILNRIQLVSDEKMSVETEKKAFDESTAKITEQQEKNLTEIFKAEQEAREQIKKDLDVYRIGLMKTREKNLSMKSNLSFLRHCHAITKPYVFSYGQHWSIEAFSRPFNQDKRKSSKPKK